ncbi:MAG: TetR/AcrR family transcriptional regulator [Rhodobacteraceae bacterium]|nr:TetR/AcrR family transcriptional regulator [Paracoccaceae bacterium]
MQDAVAILRTGRKFDQVLAGARKVFLADGFEGASVADIARAAGVSKATLYSYFPDKKLLFIEVARMECERMSDETIATIDETRPVDESLLVVARQIVTFLTSRFAQQVFRICVAESERFPELGQTFYENGPRRGCAELCCYFEKVVARGALAIDDLDMAAEQFSELCKARLWTRAVFGIQRDFTAQEIEEVAKAAVETFMAHYGSA